MFFLFIRGDGLLGIFDYMISPTINSMYLINSDPIRGLVNWSVVNPLEIFQPEKFLSRLVDMSEHKLATSSEYWLNDKYNLTNAISSISFLTGSGNIFFAVIFSTIVNQIRNRSFLRMSDIVLLCFFVYVMSFSFTIWHLWFTKLWFTVGVVWFVGILINSMATRDNLSRNA